MSDELIRTLLWIVPLAPLVASLLAWTQARRPNSEIASWLTIGGIGAAAVASILLLFGLPKDGEVTTTVYRWLEVGTLVMDIELRADAMTVMMLVTVTTVSLLVAIYSRGYMHGDVGYGRYFAEIALFVFAMCMLVVSSGFLMAFIFWEGVGVCSYLLIGYWFQKPSASAAAKKAFVVNRIGDFGFLVALMLIWVTFGSFRFEDVFDAQRLSQIAAQNPALIPLICVSLLVGAMGKSAQFPLHVWLPDAMEGPTPVSALIHAATMVTAGIYLVARSTPLFVMASDVQIAMMCIGALTALLSALIALSQQDLKRVLAYSTVSQLGYMFIALGAAGFSEDAAAFAVTAAMFHLFTHAFFKALLFLGAGSVMHAMGNVIDMREFSGLRRLMPKTHLTFLIGTATLAGFPLLSGFWSKDEILMAIENGIHHDRYGLIAQVVLATAIMTAALTAFYSFRAYFKTFWGPEKIPAAAGHHAHESPNVMTMPLIVLAIASLFVGAIFGPTQLFAGYLAHTPGFHEYGHAAINWLIMGLGVAAGLIGLAAAWAVYGVPTPRELPHAPMAAADVRTPAAAAPEAVYPQPRNWLVRLSYNKFYLDEFFEWLLVGPLALLGAIFERWDLKRIDGAIDWIASVPQAIGRLLRPFQNGLTTQYSLGMAIGVIILLVAIIYG
jgi:NADH-quinone oxidoreductase subunit L